MLWTRTCINDHLSYSGRKHTFIQEFYMFITFIKRKYDYISKINNITYLMMNSFRNQLRRCNVPPNHRPTCSLISQQRYHPWTRNDSTRNKELTDSHIANNNNTTRVHSSAKPTQLGLSSEQQISQANKVGFIGPSKSWERLNAKLVSSLKS